MKENIKKFPTHYTFDLDGTLIDGKGELKDGVVEMFDEILANVKEPVFTIASGARINQVEAAMNKINARLKNGQARYNVVANSGSIIRTTSGKISINALKTCWKYPLIMEKCIYKNHKEGIFYGGTYR